jgi:hypothetical protein
MRWRDFGASLFLIVVAIALLQMSLSSTVFPIRMRRHYLFASKASR